MKRPPEEKPDGAPEWMVSFADMITIMMSFFVIMFALASADKGKRNEQRRDKVLESLEYRFGPKWKPFASWSVNSGSSPMRDASGRISLRPGPSSPADADLPQIRNKQPARIMIPKLGEQLAIGGSVIFGDGVAELSDSGRAMLRAVAAEVAGKPQQIEVLGHASTRPLSGSLYADRWELAFQRCRRVTDELESLGIDRARIRMAVGRNAGLRTSSAGPSLEGADSRIDIYLTDRVLQNSDDMAGE